MVRALAALALLYAIGAGSASRRLGEAGVCPAGQVVDPLEERTFANSASECPSGKIGVRSNRKCCWLTGPGSPCCAAMRRLLSTPLNETVQTECFSCIPAASSVCPAGQFVDQNAERTWANSTSECSSGRIGVTTRSNRKCCWLTGPGSPCCAAMRLLSTTLNETVAPTTVACIPCVSASEDSSVQAPQPEPSGFPFAYVGAAAGCVALVGAALVVKRRRSAGPAATSVVGMPDH